MFLLATGRAGQGNKVGRVGQENKECSPLVVRGRENKVLLPVEG